MRTARQLTLRTAALGCAVGAAWQVSLGWGLAAAAAGLAVLEWSFEDED
jgi:hypothetical protein